VASEELDHDQRLVLTLCICSSCPSWVECGEKGGYCAPGVGRSKKIRKERGCICGGCPVAEKFGLVRDYFCTRGSEKEQMGR
jgi:hypothetical protein